jgi:hypothetical protein
MMALREINLEIGYPAAADAVARLREELARAKKQHCTAVKVIHGYGSTGKGGRIRTECRRELAAAAAAGKIAAYLPGENFSIFEEATRRAFSACPALRGEADLDAYNRGVTFVLL